MPDRGSAPRLFAALAAGAILASPPAALRAETVYRWVDDDGTLHLTNQKPPPGVEAEKFYIRDGPRPARGSPAQPQQQRQVARATPAQQAARSDALRALQARQCEIAREGLEALGDGGDPAERRRLQQLADQNCR